MTGPRHTPLRLAVLTDAPRVAGSEIWLLDVLPLLREQGIQASVFLPQGAAMDELARRCAERGLEVTRHDGVGTLGPATASFDLRLLQAWTPHTYAAAQANLATPYLTVVHDQLDYHYPLGLKVLFQLIYAVTKARPLRRVGTVVTVSRWGQAFLERRMRLRGVLGVTNGVDTAVFAPAPAEARAALRRHLGFDTFTVLVPGRFALEKNQLAAVLAARHCPDLTFVFVGDMDSPLGVAARLLTRGLRLTNVRFLGRRWDMPALYQAADVLLQPTLAENQSLVTLEAMASGLPVVTTAIPAQAELVRDGADGLLVPPQPRLLAQALRALAQAPVQTAQLGRQARERVLSNHRLEHTAAQVADLIHRAARP
ncbi:glycosyltransferase family 4 protein [Deinococcus sp. HMF7604]|uniref:glycosyltransferase family 4 protein n=1 Tax=Deinococcus betulae TaxID=2873312 RepID=UPI001CCD7BBD|nr:glycosyltransferase family 4 protein [Deinococcus betulae]MBZ9751462.1 glycosyltransferase family 4 protein [Deinococcus betulae]